MGEQENNKTGGGNNAMAVADEASAAAAKEKGRGAADPRLQGISDAIRVVPHFPKEGARALLCLRLRPRPAAAR